MQHRRSALAWKRHEAESHGLKRESQRIVPLVIGTVRVPVKLRGVCFGFRENRGIQHHGARDRADANRAESHERLTEPGGGEPRSAGRPDIKRGNGSSRRKRRRQKLGFPDLSGSEQIHSGRGGDGLHHRGRTPGNTPLPADRGPPFPVYRCKGDRER